MKRWLVTGGALLLLAGAPAGADLQSGLGAMKRSDYATALKNLAPLAESGDPAAQFGMGQMYLNGWGVRKNEAEAARWMQKAAAQGNTGAQKILASMYRYGLGVAKSPEEEKKWSRKALEGEAASAQFQSAEFYAGETKKSGLSQFHYEALEGGGLTSKGASQLEAGLAANPGDLSLRARLLGYYSTRSVRDSGRKATLLARRRHVLWIIGNRPESALAQLAEAVIYPHGPALADEEGYAQAKALWLRQVEARKDELTVLLNAAHFFQLHDKPLAETLLRNGEARYPQDLRFKARLGYLYALGILGVDGLNTNAIPVSVDLAEQDGAFARKALSEVNTSHSGMLVGAAAFTLNQYLPMVQAIRPGTNDFSYLAYRLLMRAQTMDPRS
ncbi:MAG: tetratricopeptide repeat protein [bacterium]|nr:tetratricopeptide repeat protein [bacterium]